MKRVCFITVARNERHYLPMAIDYYARVVPKEDMYVVAHNNTDNSLDNIEANITHWKTDYFSCIALKERKDEERLRLHKEYKWVICVDPDEFFVPDPAIHPNGLDGYLDWLEENNIETVRGVGQNVFHDMNSEPSIVKNKPFLPQRKFWGFHKGYSKVGISSKYVEVTNGYHQCLGDYQDDNNLYCVHTHYADYEILCDRAREWTTANIKEKRKGHNWQNKIGVDEMEKHLKDTYENAKKDQVLSEIPERMKIF